MSDINDGDDLLNCELLGDLDHTLLGDEDDLLLSDEEANKDENKKTSNDGKPSTKSNESMRTKINKKHIENKSRKLNEISQSQETSIENKVELFSSKIDLNEKNESFVNVTTSSGSINMDENVNNEKIDSSNGKEILISINEDIVSQNDEVSSTNKEIKPTHNRNTSEINQNYLQVSKQEANLEELNYEPDVREEDSEENPSERLNIKQAAERENSDESPDKNQQNIRYFFGKRGRGRGGFIPRTYIHNVRMPFNNRHLMGGPIKNDNNLSQQGIQQCQYSTNSLSPYANEIQGQIPVPRQSYPLPNHMNPRMDFPHHRPMGPSYLPNLNENTMGPRMFGQRHIPNNGMMSSFNNGPQLGNLMRPIYRPSDPNQIQPRMPLRLQGPISLGIQNNCNYASQSVSQISHHSMQSNLAGNPQQNVPNSSVLPRKVLINPNFKGGVEAATNQLMKDTQFIQTISSHVSHLQSDEELLRQQEEFIKKNQMQIDKRRYARSPGKSRSRSRSRGRVRSRERSFSPPRRREFYRERRGGGNTRGVGARNRRATSRDWENDKRRRSFSSDRKEKDKNYDEEDDETRAYRLEIEKQKAMREKILKDKEMRRRKAAEDKLNEDKIEELTKLKPIVVTESKIISLKKIKDKAELEMTGNSNNATNNNYNSSAQRGTLTNNKNTSMLIPAAKQNNPENNSPQRAIKRPIPTAKILPDAKRSLNEHIRRDIAITNISGNSSKNSSHSSISSTTAIVKPVLKKSVIVEDLTKKQQKNSNSSDELLEEYDDELLEEDRLLASPTPSPSNTPEIERIDDETEKLNDNTSDENENFVNEDIKKPKKSFMSSNRKVLLKPFQKHEKRESTKKKVFERLEKTKVTIKESAKKRIQRIIE